MAHAAQCENCVAQCGQQKSLTPIIDPTVTPLSLCAAFSAVAAHKHVLWRPHGVKHRIQFGWQRLWSWTNLKRVAALPTLRWRYEVSVRALDRVAAFAFDFPFAPHVF